VDDTVTAAAPADPEHADRVDSYLRLEFAALFSAEYGRIVALVLSLVRNIELAEDIAQEAFLITHRRWRKVQRFDRPGAFVRRVALNLAVSRARRMSREAVALERLFARRAPQPSTPQPDSFWDLVAELSPRQRQVVALRYVEDYSTEHIAAVLGVAEGTVRAQLHTARQRLAAGLEESEESSS
jgi:RNA polymerase sigma-70 factor (ECF subfamily)